MDRSHIEKIAKTAEDRNIPKKESGQLLFPGGQETGVNRDLFSYTGLDLIPELGKEHPVFRTVGNFVNIVPIHCITATYYSTSYCYCK